MSFLRKPCLFTRLIDDFILITPFRDEAIQFLELMFNGIEEYGITVRPEKCLANFDASVRGFAVARIQGSRKFPYCGLLIDEISLDVEKDYTLTLQNGNVWMFTLTKKPTYH